MATKFDDSNLKVYREDNEAYKFTVTRDGNPVDLSDATNPGIVIKSQGRDDFDSPTTLFDITITDGVDGNDHANGIVVLVLPTTVTLVLPEKSRYDLQFTIGTKITTIAKGQLLLTKDVTRP